MAGLSLLQKLAQDENAQVLENEPMSRHTTFQIGGPAELFITPDSLAALEKIAGFCKENGIRLTPLGNGSNLLVSDAGLPGAVVKIGEAFAGITVEGDILTAGAGASLSAVCRAALEHGLTGLEFAYGIPGSVGGAVFMNAGAYGGEMKDVVRCATHLGDGGIQTVCGAALDFGYRHSCYSAGGKVIVSAQFGLRPGDPTAIRARMEELYARRKAKQPLEYPSAGSVFKRPAGYFAGTLIEQCGLKGARRGGACVSGKHAGFIVNDGNATCADVLQLIEYIQNEVFRRTGVTLESEIRVLQ